MIALVVGLPLALLAKLAWLPRMGKCPGKLPYREYWLAPERRARTLERLGAVREWTNSWQDGGRVVRTGDDPAERRFAKDDLTGVGFRVVRGMTGR